jgi:hypothetical protein
MSKSHQSSMTALMIGCLLGTTDSALGWGAYAHYWVGKQVGLGRRANLPDYWGQSWAAHWDPALYFEIVPLFPWTHGCMRTGLIPGAPPYPATPTLYGQARAIAEWDMFHLVQRMSCTHQQALGASEMVDTSRGFLVHNSFDLHGHFALFPGGTPTNWVKHALLEEYVDYRILALEHPEILMGSGTISKQVGSQGHAGIILLAQKSFRKNCNTIDLAVAHSGSYDPGPVETLATTAQQLQDQANHLSYMGFTCAEYNTVVAKLAPLYGSDIPTTEQLLESWWEESVEPNLQTWAGQAIAPLSSMPPVDQSGCLSPP